MATTIRPTVAGSPPTFSEALTRIRRRWRWRHAAVGLAITLAVLLVAFWGTAVAMQGARFSPASVAVGRWVLGLLLLVVGGRWIGYPLLRPLPDRRLALYVEERVPELDGAVLSAVEVAAASAPDEARSGLLTRSLFADASRRLARLPAVGRLETSVTRRALIVALLLAASGATLVLLGPAWISTSARLLLTPWRDVAAAPVYAIAVEPGNATIARGSDFQVSARLVGFRGEVVELSVRRGANGEWERLAMGPGSDSTQFSVRLFDVAEASEYYVESNGVRSEAFRITVRDLPAVRRLDLELQYPAYTGLAPEQMEDVGDIAAVKGSRAVVKVRSTRAVRGGRIVLDGDSTIALTLVDDSTLSATVAVRRDGFYRVELEAPDGTRVAANVDYVIDAMDDLAPQVVVKTPGRDLRPTTVEEVLIEAEASDDFGVGRLELHYTVNGGAEQVVVLSEGKGRRPRELSAGHTFFLEEWSLQPGDVVSYYVKAWDNDAVSGAKSATSDIYFLTMRPFDREYRQNQQGGGGGGGEQGEDPGTLVARQREIVAATFKAERDRAASDAATFRTDVTTIALSQGRLREQVQQTTARLQRRAVQATDTTFRVIAEMMPKVAEEMRAAEELLGTRKLREALAPEQRALQLLERVDALFKEVQVSMQNGGGGGGGGSSNAEDIADLFELENDKLRNQYEQVQSGQQQQASREVDETLERLKRLAARQQQENERARQRASTSAGGGGSGGAQRQMAEEAEQLARRLERLAREQQSPEMQQTARALQDAASEMRRAAAGDGQRGTGSGSAAQDRLESARRLLEESRGQQTARGVEGAAARARQLAQEQRQVQEEVRRLGQSGSDRADRTRRLDERKETMARGVEELEQQLDQLSRDALRERAETARRLKDAANRIREQRLDDLIRYSRGVMRSQAGEYADSVESTIAQALDSLQQRIGGAATAAVSDSAQRRTRALAQARDLVRSLAGIEERMRERLAAGDTASGGARGERESPSGRRLQSGGNEGQPGSQAGQQSQSGQQAQSGQQGQSGQAGQQGQGQQGQGQAGEQGQGGQGGRMGQGGARGGAQGRVPNGGQAGGSGQGAPGGGRFSADDARQFSRELRGQRESAEALRRDLAREGVDAAELERLIGRLRALESGRSFNDAEELARLRVAVLEGFKEFEFSLRRQLGEREREGPVLGGGNEVPPGYRDLVSEYFRSLTRKAKP